jgi:hypothetical protein
VGIHADHNAVTGYAARWNGHTWVAHEAGPARAGLDIVGVSALTPNDVWIVGSAGASQPSAVIEHWDGSSWTDYPG